MRRILASINHHLFSHDRTTENSAIRWTRKCVFSAHRGKALPAQIAEYQKPHFMLSAGRLLATVGPGLLLLLRFDRYPSNG